MSLHAYLGLIFTHFNSLKPHTAATDAALCLFPPPLILAAFTSLAFLCSGGFKVYAQPKSIILK